MDVTMFQMGFGESILIHQGDSCLLVDCGSESQSRKMCFKNVAEELGEYRKKSLLISHFHNDHTNGIRFLREENLSSFERIFLPHIFASGDYSLDVLIAEYLLEALLDRRRKSPQIWGCLIPMLKVNRSIVLLQKGTFFNAANCDFQTLWPPVVSICGQESWNEFVSEYSFLQLPTQEINYLAQRTRWVMQQITGIEDVPIRIVNVETELQDVLNQFLALCESYIGAMFANNGKSIIPMNDIEKAYCSIKKKNETSVVFRTADERKKQILMTGDVTQKIMQAIVESDVFTGWPQKKRYDIIKAPHHGTNSTYFDFSKYYDYEELYISNGETTWSERRRGKISVKYFAAPHTSSIQCRNTQKRRCEYAMENGRCSNRCVECSVNDW